MKQEIRTEKASKDHWALQSGNPFKRIHSLCFGPTAR